jgi:SAM-dependent methyltransferase
MTSGLFVCNRRRVIVNRETALVKGLYSRMVDHEWNRLFQDDFHRLEWNTTWRFLGQYLPKAGLVLDAGGGPGRYTIELASRGYDAILLDLVGENLRRAGEEIQKAGVGKRVMKVVDGTITDLSRFDDNTFDAVLCLGGPLSHICPESQRLTAVAELVRVARPGAPVFASVISKYGVLLATPEGWPQAVTDKQEDFPRLVETGDSYRFAKDGYCHFFTSSELERLFMGQKVEVIQKVGLEGFNTDEKTTNDFAANLPDAWKEWLRLHEALCTLPFAVDASGHMMIIVRKDPLDRAIARRSHGK